MAKRKQKTTTVERVTAGTTIRLEQPSSKRGAKPKSSALVVIQEANPVTGFNKFLRDYGVVGVAVGFAIASQAQLLIKALIDNLINPMYAIVFNSGRIEAQTKVFHFHGRAAEIKWGLVITQLTNFLFVLMIIYILVRVLGLHKSDEEKEEEK